MHTIQMPAVVFGGALQLLQDGAVSAFVGPTAVWLCSQVCHLLLYRSTQQVNFPCTWSCIHVKLTWLAAAALAHISKLTPADYTSSCQPPALHACLVTDALLYHWVAVL